LPHAHANWYSLAGIADDRTRGCLGARVVRILLVNIQLVGRSGTEVVCCETARGLRRRGHDVAIYIRHDGPPAEELRAEGFHVTNDLSSITQAPDVIQANQTFPLVEAIGRFPATPAISICHDATVWFNEPLDLPTIRRHVAVDFACRDRIASAMPNLDGQIEILQNAVDLDSFQPRAPLPRRPARALVLAKGPSFLDSVRDACAQRGLELSIVGPGIGNEVDDLPSYFRSHDLVFASARSALEAMATGCAVIVLDGRGFAGLVTHDVVSTWRQNNFGLRLLKRPVSTELILDAIDHYDAAEAQRVCNFIRANSSLDQYLDRLEAMYREVITESAENPADRGDLLYQMGLSIQRIESAWSLEAHAAAGREVQSACNELNARFEQRLRAREAELRAESRQAMDVRERELEQQRRASASALRAEFRQEMAFRERELEQQRRARESEASAREAELSRRAAELRRQTDLKAAEFAAFRAWVAPRNLPRRIFHRVRRGLFGR